MSAQESRQPKEFLSGISPAERKECQACRLCKVGTSFSKIENFINSSACTRNSFTIPILGLINSVVKI